VHLQGSNAFPSESEGKEVGGGGVIMASLFCKVILAAVRNRFLLPCALDLTHLQEISALRGKSGGVCVGGGGSDGRSHSNLVWLLGSVIWAAKTKWSPRTRIMCTCILSPVSSLNEAMGHPSASNNAEDPNNGFVSLIKYLHGLLGQSCTVGVIPLRRERRKEKRGGGGYKDDTTLGRSPFPTP